MRAAAERLAATRPTAVNLAWGVERALDAYERGGAGGALADRRSASPPTTSPRNRALGAHGAALVPDDAQRADALQRGRARVRRLRHRARRGARRARSRQARAVWADETRPLLQGARLTVWELDRLGIDATLVADGAAAPLMARGEVDLVVVGADRIAANGDVANKIGTYGSRCSARHHGSRSTSPRRRRRSTSRRRPATSITIEERDRDEVTHRARDVRSRPAGVAAHNPAFDVTPARLVTAIVTEVGIARRRTAARCRAHVRRAAVAVAPAP